MILPPRLLSAVSMDIESQATWDTSENGDAFVGYPFRWTVTFTITPQQHSYPFSQIPNFYSGMDIQVGDWYSDLPTGAAVQIIEIVSADSTNVVAVCEDVDRYNIFTDPTQSGTGIGAIGSQAYIFQLGDDGLPILAPMSGFATILQGNVGWQLDQISRFRYRNLLHSYYRVDQPGHSFAVGDTVYLKADGTYATVDPTNATVVAAAGSVSSIGIPGPDWFSIRPVGRVVQNLSPALPGVPGELIYLTQTGLSNVAPSRWSTPQYIQLEVPTTGIALNRGVDTAGTAGYVNRTFVVPDQNTANATLAVTNSGDQVMVDDAGYGEWTHYVVHQNTLRAISTQDSARVDAESLEVAIAPNTTVHSVVVNGISMNAVLMGNISAGRSISTVSVQVTAAFDANAVITVGTVAAADTIIPSALIDLTALGSYTNSPTLEFTQPYTSIYAFVAYNTSPAGNAVITVSYA